MDQLMMVAGVSGKLVTPQEAETMYRLENQELASSMVFFAASNNLSKVTVTPQVLGEFYSNQLANYKVPEQVRVDYVKFNVTNYFPATIAALTNLNQLVDANVQRLGTNLYRGAKTPEESRANVRDEIIREHAIVDVRRAASAFAVQLDDMKPRVADSLVKLAALSNLTVKATAPFDRDYGPQDIIVPPGFAQKAFGLTQDDPFAGPIVAEDGAYVIALKQRLAAETPTLAKIEDKVTADYRYSQALYLARVSASLFENTLTNGLGAGKTFSAICGLTGAQPEALPPISLNTRSLPDELENRVNFNLLRQVLFSTSPGHASSVVSAKDGSFVIYVDKLLPVDDTKLKTELPGFVTYVRNMRQNDAFNMWFNAQIRQDPDFLQLIQRFNEQTQLKAGSPQRAKS
jgi:hypothetical protein